MLTAPIRLMRGRGTLAGTRIGFSLKKRVHCRFVSTSNRPFLLICVNPNQRFNHRYTLYLVCMAGLCNLVRVHSAIGMGEVTDADLVIGKGPADCFRHLPDPLQVWDEEEFVISSKPFTVILNLGEMGSTRCWNCYMPDPALNPAPNRPFRNSCGIGLSFHGFVARAVRDSRSDRLRHRAANPRRPRRGRYPPGSHDL